MARDGTSQCSAMESRPDYWHASRARNSLVTDDASVSASAVPVSRTMRFLISQPRAVVLPLSSRTNLRCQRFPRLPLAFTTQISSRHDLRRISRECYFLALARKVIPCIPHEVSIRHHIRFTPLGRLYYRRQHLICDPHVGRAPGSPAVDLIPDYLHLFVTSVLVNPPYIRAGSSPRS